MRRASRFAKRLFSGDDVVLVLQTNEHWERQFTAGAWDRLVDDQPNTLLLRDRIVSVLRERGSCSVLDVGCGNGGLTKLLAEHAGITYCGTDISAVAIERARTFMPSGRFVVGDAQAPPSDLGTFDIIVFNEVFYYFDAARTLATYKTYARSDTVLLISVVRSWRSFFVWSRVHTAVRVEEKWHTEDRLHQWDMALARYR